MGKFITTPENNDLANTENLALLCKALGVSQNVVRQVTDFDADIFNSFGAKETVTILTEIVEDYVDIYLVTDISDKTYRICSLCPAEEGPYWEWVLEYIRDIFLGELIKKDISYEVLNYPSYNDTLEIPFPTENNGEKIC